MARAIVANCHFLLNWCQKSEVETRLTSLLKLVLDALSLFASHLRLVLERIVGLLGSRYFGLCWADGSVEVDLYRMLRIMETELRDYNQYCEL
jgi:hypothetical protein